MFFYWSLPMSHGSGKCPLFEEVSETGLGRGYVPKCVLYVLPEGQEIFS